MKFFYTYVLRSMRDGDLYTGFSTDLQKRFEDHENGRVLSTRGRRLFQLIRGLFNGVGCKEKGEVFKNI